MVSTTIAYGHMETVEANKEQIREPDKVGNQEIESVGMCQYTERLLAHSCKLKNRRVPNGTHGGLRGRNGK
jgi:hypothetical protein